MVQSMKKMGRRVVMTGLGWTLAWFSAAGCGPSFACPDGTEQMADRCVAVGGVDAAAPSDDGGTPTPTRDAGELQARRDGESSRETSDAGPPDAGPPDAGPPDAGLSCVGASDLTPCVAVGDAGRGICVRGACVESRCGDDIVDVMASEQCDDGNSVADDGCEPTCRWTCENALDCDDGETCNGAERCDTRRHVCERGTEAPTPSPCSFGGVEGAGTCDRGVCREADCGDGVLASWRGEECDDGNEIDGDGCESTCQFSCRVAADCDDNEPCNGAERCDTTAHVCRSGAPLVCDDAQRCTDDRCVPGRGCEFTVIDADHDGFPPSELGACVASGRSLLLDCADHDGAINPMAVESPCDSVDSNCNGSRTDGRPPIACRVDADGDGQGVGAVAWMCSCPAGWSVASEATDCVDRPSDGANVHVGQSTWFGAAWCNTSECLGRNPFDFDCDGVATLHVPTLAPATCGTCFREGWVDRVPACGEMGTLVRCVFDTFHGTCARLVSDQKQLCR